MTNKELEIVRAMAKTLEGYGWNIYDRRNECTLCGEDTISINPRFCSNCGAKLSLRRDQTELAHKELFCAYLAGKNNDK